MLKKCLKITSVLTASLLMLACQTPSQSVHYVPQKVTGLKTPESVLQAKDGRIFVSEINGFGKDGDGQISVIDSQGKLAVFATGLDDPKGLAMIGSNFYVADKTNIIKVSADGKTSVFVPAASFPTLPLFLNDITADPQGNLYVSDSGDLFNTGKGGAIYKISPEGKVTLLISALQDARIKAPNGLLIDDAGEVLLCVDFTSGVLYQLNIKSGAVADIASGFGGGDGLVRHTNGTMYLSDWKNGKVFSLSLTGVVQEIKSGYQAAADIALSQDQAYLMVPDMKAGELDFIAIGTVAK